MKRAVIALAAAAALAASGVTASLALGGRPNNSGNKVTICHATGSAKNPYVEITPDASGVISGHYAHQDHRDIIPPFDYYDSHGALHHFAGQNWTAEGQAIFENGCKKPGSPGSSPPPPPVTPGATTTVTVNQPTPGPTKTVTVVVKKQVTVIKKIHVRTGASASPKVTG